MTTRDEIAKGPKFEAGEAKECVACQAFATKPGYMDRETGLCCSCWRVWRFAARIHQFGEGVPSANFGVVTIEEIRRAYPLRPCPTCGAKALPPDQTPPTSCPDPWHLP